jgi:hypothetical protein
LRVSDNRVRTAKLDTIKQVERLDPELESDIFVDRGVLIESKVIVCNSRSAQLIVRPGFIAVSEERHWVGVEASKVEIVVRSALHCPQTIEDAAPNRFLTARGDVRPGVTAKSIRRDVVGCVGKAQWVTSLKRGYTVDAPARSNRPATDAPEGSVTVPTMDPVVV